MTETEDLACRAGGGGSGREGHKIEQPHGEGDEDANS